MTKHFGRSYVATPGPSVIPERVLRAMHQPAPNIYSRELEALVESIIVDLKVLVGTKYYSVIYIANGHGAWEAAIANLFAPGDEILTLNTGIFAQGWASCAEAMGIKVHTLDFGLNHPVDLDQFADRIKLDSNKTIKGIIVCQADTSTSVKNDIQGISTVLKTLNHPAILAVDCIASFGCDYFSMDDWDVDVVLSASQKGLMTPPGLAFLSFNERARECAKNKQHNSLYWDWERRIFPEEFYFYFCGTAPTHHLYGLREALNMIIHEEGKMEVFKRHKRMARMIWAAIDAWALSGPITINIADPKRRSHAVTVVKVGKPYGSELRHWVEDHTGLTLGIGLGMGTKEDPNSTGIFRIGHMGHVNGNMVMGLLGSIEAGFEHLAIPRGAGAIEAAAKVLATS